MYRTIMLIIILFLMSSMLIAQDELELAYVDLQQFHGKKIPATLLETTSVNFQDVTVDYALNAIMEQTDIKLNYNRDKIPLFETITLKLDNVYVLEALVSILNGSNMNMQITSGGQIAITQGIGGGGGSARKISGVIKGVVADKVSGDVLPGANVYLEGTSIGTATDVDGSFVIHNVPPGIYTLKISYIGYNENEYDLFIKTGQTITQNAELEWVAVEAGSVTITAQAEGQMKAINRQLSSRTIMNSVAAERIQEFPDDNAAAAVSRLPGISLNGDQVVIRGLGGNFNKILVNGVSLPSTSVNSRSVGLNVISPNMLSGIEVTKALTPDLDGDAVGGVVNLKLREAPAGFHSDFLAQGSYNRLKETYDNYKVWGSISNRFFNDKLGVFAQLNNARSNGGYEELGASWNMGVNTENLPNGERPYYLSSLRLVNSFADRNNYGASFNLDYTLDNFKIVFHNMYNGRDSEETFNRETINNLTSGPQMSFRFDHSKFHKEIYSNSLQAEYNLFDITMDYGLTHAYSSRDTDFDYTFFMKDAEPPKQFTGYKETSPLYIQQNNIQAELVQYPVLDLQNQLDYNALNQHVQLHYPEVFDSKYSERQWTHVFNIEKPMVIASWLSGKIKAGGKYRKMNRNADETRAFSYEHRMDAELPYHDMSEEAINYFQNELGVIEGNNLNISNIVDTDYELPSHYLNGDFFIANNVDKDKAYNAYKYLTDDEHTEGFMKVDESNSNRNDHKGIEKLSAGYLMSTFDIGRSLMVMGGVRYERMETEYTGVITAIGGIRADAYPLFPVSKTRINEHWLPSVHLKYKLNDWTDIRAAWTQSLVRPNYDQFLPSIVYDVTLIKDIETGNPDLLPSLAENLDLSVSVYSNTIGLFTVGGFYKEMDDLVYNDRFLLHKEKPEVAERIMATGGADPVSDYVEMWTNNPYTGYLHGFDIDWQTNFWYLPKPFNNVVLNVNYSFINSKTKYPLSEFEKQRIPGSRKSELVRIDSVKYHEDRILHQPKHIMNISLGYDLSGFSSRLSFKYIGDVLTSQNQKLEERRRSEPMYSWDLSLKQQLPWDGFQLFFDAVNFTNFYAETFQLFGPDTDSHNMSSRKAGNYSARPNSGSNFNSESFSKFQIGIRYTH